MLYSTIRLEDEWVVEHIGGYDFPDQWRPVIRDNTTDDSLEGCVNWWNKYQKLYKGVMPKHLPIESFRIRNTDTDEIIPCAALT